MSSNTQESRMLLEWVSEQWKALEHSREGDPSAETQRLITNNQLTLLLSTEQVLARDDLPEDVKPIIRIISEASRCLLDGKDPLYPEKPVNEQEIPKLASGLMISMVSWPSGPNHIERVLANF